MRLEQVRVALARLAACLLGSSSGSLALLVAEQLHGARRIDVVLLSLEQPERGAAAHEDVHAAVLHLLQHLGDARRAADLLQAVVGQPHDPELAPSSRHSAIIVL